MTAKANEHSREAHRIHERAEFVEANQVWCSVLGLTVRPLRMLRVDSRTRAVAELFASGYKPADLARMARAAKTDAWVRGDDSEPPKSIQCLTPTVAARLLDSLEHAERKAKAKAERKARELAEEQAARRKESERREPAPPFDIAKIFAMPPSGPSIPEGAPRRLTAEEINRALEARTETSQPTNSKPDGYMAKSHPAALAKLRDRESLEALAVGGRAS